MDTLSPCPEQPLFSANWLLFAPIRARFDGPGRERGGCPRLGITPVYVRKFGEHAASIFPGLSTVESTFTSEQLQAVTASILALKRSLAGGDGGVSFTQRIIEHYLSSTRPYFLAAQLRAIEDVLLSFITSEPLHVPALDALFRVAGSEGLRDLLWFYDPRVLACIITKTEPSFPDIMAFVNIHERTVRNAAGQREEQRFEVWCPGVSRRLILVHHQLS